MKRVWNRCTSHTIHSRASSDPATRSPPAQRRRGSLLHNVPVISVRDLARREREQFADLLAGLTPQQWDAPSLCAGWTVREVAAHTLAYLGQTHTRLAINMLRAGGNTDRLNARGLPAYTALSAEQLVELMRRGGRPSGAGALYGGRVALIECLIHHAGPSGWTGPYRRNRCGRR